jgi:hypothetical protein
MTVELRQMASAAFVRPGESVPGKTSWLRASPPELSEYR